MTGSTFDEFEEIVVESPNVSLTLEWIGEGLDGDYDGECEQDYTASTCGVCKDSGVHAPSTRLLRRNVPDLFLCQEHNRAYWEGELNV